MTNYFEVLRRPLITEKTNYQNGQLHQYVFEVREDANKTLVKDAIEHLFDVTVMRVNVINVPAKRKRNLRNRRTSQRRGSYKKAIVTLAPGDTIAVFEGVK
jgi:large subunit ribosomal protein L23